MTNCKHQLNNRKLYAEYSIGDFDKHDCLKISQSIYLILLFVLRGYIVWIMSVTNMKDRVSIIEFVYPDPKLFYFSLFSGMAGLFVVFLLALRRPDASLWVQKIWPHSRKVILFALLFDLLITMLGFWFWQLFSAVELLLHIAVVTGLTVYLFKSQRFCINLMEFPQKVAAD